MENLKRDGNVAVSKDRLEILAKGELTACAQAFNIRAESPSNP
jgi:hypothetical protein